MTDLQANRKSYYAIV